MENCDCICNLLYLLAYILYVLIRPLGDSLVHLNWRSTGSKVFSQYHFSFLLKRFHVHVLNNMLSRKIRIGKLKHQIPLRKEGLIWTIADQAICNQPPRDMTWSFLNSSFTRNLKLELLRQFLLPQPMRSFVNIHLQRKCYYWQIDIYSIVLQCQPCQYELFGHHKHKQKPSKIETIEEQWWILFFEYDVRILSCCRVRMGSHT